MQKGILVILALICLVSCQYLYYKDRYIYWSNYTVSQLFKNLKANKFKMPNPLNEGYTYPYYYSTWFLPFNMTLLPFESWEQRTIRIQQYEAEKQRKQRIQRFQEFTRNNSNYVDRPNPLNNPNIKKKHRDAYKRMMKLQCVPRSGGPPTVYKTSDYHHLFARFLVVGVDAQITGVAGTIDQMKKTLDDLTDQKMLCAIKGADVIEAIIPSDPKKAMPCMDDPMMVEYVISKAKCRRDVRKLLKEYQQSEEYSFIPDQYEQDMQDVEQQPPI